MADYWIKFYIEILEDPKMAVLPDRIWRRIAELFLVAGKMQNNGHIPDTRQIAWILRMRVDELEPDLEQIKEIGIIDKTETGWYVKKYQKRQGPSTTAERKQAQRNRERSRQYDGDRHVTVTSRDSDVKQNQNQNQIQIQKQNDIEGEWEEKKSGFLVEELEGPKGLEPIQVDFLQRVIRAFSTRFANQAQIDMALNLYGVYGDKAIEALTWYATKETPLGEAITRAENSLPTWGEKQNHTQARDRPKRPAQQAIDPRKAALQKLREDTANGPPQ